MINHMLGTQTQVTDFNIGSVARTMVEAPAIEIDELYQQMFNGLKEAIPVATYSSFNFGLLPAVPASGIVTVTIAVNAANVLIAAGTVFSFANSQINYVSQSDVTITAGSTTASVYAVANTAGVASNLAASTALTSSPNPIGFVSATNAAAFPNGLNVETPAQRKQRFSLFIAALPRGTVAALNYGASTAALYDVNGLQTERVQASAVVEPYVSDNTQPIGLVNLYVHNGVGSTSAGLVTQCQAVINGYTDSAGVVHVGWKAAGVSVVVAAASEVTIACTGLVTPAVGYSGAAMVTAVTGVLNSYILGLNLGQSFVFSQATSLIMDLPGVANFVFSTPTADHTATASQKLMPGTMTITHP